VVFGEYFSSGGVTPFQTQFSGGKYSVSYFIENVCDQFVDAWKLLQSRPHAVDPIVLLAIIESPSTKPVG
jgi:hypothetical protein